MSVRDERDFIHSLGGPLAAAIMSLDQVIETVQTGDTIDPKLVDRLRLTQRALIKTKELLQDRRRQLIQELETRDIKDR